MSKPGGLVYEKSNNAQLYSMKTIHKSEPVLTDDIHWRMTPGIGDVMTCLNSAHRTAHSLDKVVNLTLHWYFDPEIPHTPEDPENILERLYYVHDFYHDQDRIIIKHQYPGDESLRSIRVRGTFKGVGNGMSNSWWFRESCYLPTDKNKIVVWRPTFNAETARDWKLIINHYEWDKVLDNFRALGYNIVELCYRTPIREAMYHINTCRFTVSYDGMWHFMARNFWKPMIVVSRSRITQFVTPWALMMNEKDVFHYTRHFNTKKKRQILFENHYMDKQAFMFNKLTPQMTKLLSGVEQIEKRATWYRYKIMELHNDTNRQSSN